MSEAELTLKATPPRLPRSALERELLLREWSEIGDRAVIAVVAPPGFGKTTLLMQWRRLWREQGALVAWLSVDAKDDPTRFVMALLHAVRRVASSAAVETLAKQFAAQPHQEMEALTVLLAEIAELGTETFLVLDNAEKLPDATVRESLAYVLYNAPANLHVVIGSRVPLSQLPWEAATKGDFAVLGAEELRFRPEESVEVLRQRFGERLNLDDCMRLHEATEGWPIGLQLAAATIEGRIDTSAAIASLSARRGGIERYFVESLFLRLPEPLADFLTRIAILDHLNAELCAAVTGCSSAGPYLDRLTQETPIMMVGERDWIRLHPLARDFLLGRFEQLPLAERTALHKRAFQWFAGRERFHEAASHALAAGDQALAQSYAARSLWALGTGGRMAEAREWLDHIPPDLLSKDNDLRLIAAWIIALSERHAEALTVALEILDDPATTPQVKARALRVAAGATAYADHLGLIPDLTVRWMDLPKRIDEPLYLVANLNPRALEALHRGATDEARDLAAQIATYGNTGTLRLAAAFGVALVGLSHLWEGNAHLAEATLRPALARAEQEDGRRGMIASLYAPLLAAALLERDRPEGARTLLANRLDVIEHTGCPDSILLAYRTLARVALIQGDKRHAVNVLESLGVLAEHRQLPRLKLHSLTEQIRIHALRACTDTVSRLVEALDRLAEVFQREELRLFEPQYRLAAAIANAYAALARHDLDDAEQKLETAEALAHQLHRGRDALTVKVLRAVVARLRNRADALPLLMEAVSLAELGGNARLLADTHPLAVEMWAALTPVSSGLGGTQPASRSSEGVSSSSAATGRSDVPGGQFLTPKETQILKLLSIGRPNKLIANALAISEETVKWHMKNLFLKLSAARRSQAVDRARLLGLLDG
ncbi:MAG TPA: LuxR C-terminal-related transcriptional regulator [Lysobacter sp.]|nr:LuxR C-terminal-related transcriptional regulator [Lysobacter sp.]